MRPLAQVLVCPGRTSGIGEKALASQEVTTRGAGGETEENERGI